MKKFIVLVTFFTTAMCMGQETSPQRHEYSLVFGLNQPLVLHGFNFETNIWTKRFVIDYSHGVNLKMSGGMVNAEMQAQHLNLFIPHSLGIGFGYRLTKSLNLRFEPKLHLFQLYYDGDEKTRSDMVGKYNTVTLGVGAYYRWMPFENKSSFLKGLTVSPSIRFWPNVNSTLNSDRLNYLNKVTGQTETHHAVNIGVANTPWIINVSVGYTFNTKK